ncbi:hypothetical protein [Anaerostipes sp.]|uniref:hypothetical protein n=1 Tax=Anaerostipes sp. TaxID=1872530 RepID=UPI00258F1630|nr:hypothetical protein [Anaerostipes sp.]MCI5623304.1 hypothetical protein [Anaerostipes sp.]
MKDKICRIIKIDKDALYELIYENFVAHQEEMLDVSAVKCMNNFAIDWTNGSFIFTAHKDEDENGNIVEFPKDIDIAKILEKIPATTDSIFSPNKIYKDYSFDELRKMINE